MSGKWCQGFGEFLTGRGGPVKALVMKMRTFQGFPVFLTGRVRSVNGLAMSGDSFQGFEESLTSRGGTVKQLAMGMRAESMSSGLLARRCPNGISRDGALTRQEVVPEMAWVPSKGVIARRSGC